MNKKETLLNTLKLALILIVFFKSDKSFSKIVEHTFFDTKDTNTYDFKFEQNLLNKKIIVGIGEATHNSHQEQIFRNTTIQKLILSYGFNTVLIEAPAKGTEYLNDYILDKNNSDIKALLFKTRVFYWIWKNNEFIQLLDWLKSYNKTVQKKIQIFGIDKMNEEANQTNLNNYNLKRDSIMAINIKSLIDTTPDSKCIVIAHNVHISNKKLNIYKNESMGSYLKKYYDNSYFSIGQIFGYGSFNTQITSEFNSIKSSSVKSDISNLSKELDITEKQKVILTKDIKELNKKRKIWFYGGNLNKVGQQSYFRENISEMFDAIIFYDTISPALNLLVNGNYYVKTTHITKLPQLINSSNEFNLTIDYESSCDAIIELQLYNNDNYVYSIVDTLFSKSNLSNKTTKLNYSFNKIRTNLYLFDDGKIIINRLMINDENNEKLVTEGLFEENNRVNLSITNNIKLDLKYGLGKFEMYRYSIGKN